MKFYHFLFDKKVACKVIACQVVFLRIFCFTANWTRTICTVKLLFHQSPMLHSDYKVMDSDGVV